VVGDVIVVLYLGVVLFVLEGVVVYLLLVVGCCRIVRVVIALVV